jgi:hypothetical protein
MTEVSGLGPTAVEAELRKCVTAVGGEIFKLVIDDVSVLLSFDVIPGKAATRKCNYVPYAPGRLSGAFVDLREWIVRISKQ